MTAGGRARRAAGLALILSLSLAFTTFAGVGHAATRVQSEKKLLGKKHRAKGTPVKIGFVTDGRASSFDASHEISVAKATADWVNDYRNGIGGHPIDLQICETNADPGKATDCANQMIRDDVAAVGVGQTAVLVPTVTPLREAGIPVFMYSTVTSDVAAEPNSTLAMFGGAGPIAALNIGVAKKIKTKKVSAVVIDVPAATALFAGENADPYKKAGIKLDVVPVAAGTPDMTPQMQKLVSANPDGVAYVIGNDSFCIAALNGLRTAGFEGTVTTIPQCLTDATRTAVPADFLDGIVVSATSPIDDPKDPSMKQYYAVLDKYGADDVDKANIAPVTVFNALGGFAVATEGLKGEVTPESIMAAARSMPWSVLPGTGGLHFRCNAKAVPTLPAVCTTATLAATLGADGKAKKYTPVGDTPIPD